MVFVADVSDGQSAKPLRRQSSKSHERQPAAEIGQFRFSCEALSRFGTHRCASHTRSCRLLQCCETPAEERSAVNPHAAFCGNWRRATASSDPVLGVKFPGPTRQKRRFDNRPVTSGLPQLQTCRCTALRDAKCQRRTSRILVCTSCAIPVRLDPLFDGLLESSDEEARSDPEHHQTIGGLQRRDQPHAAVEHYVAITQRRER